MIADIDTLRALTYEQLQQWAKIRNAALDAFDYRESYLYGIAGTTHETSDIRQLAAITRRERSRWGARWDEDERA